MRFFIVIIFGQSHGRHSNYCADDRRRRVYTTQSCFATVMAHSCFYCLVSRIKLNVIHAIEIKRIKAHKKKEGNAAYSNLQHAVLALEGI